MLSATCAGALVLTLAHSCPALTPVWIDTDVSIGSAVREVDDAYALILALHSPELRIAGLSTTYGNSSEDNVHRVATGLVTRFGDPLHLSGREIYSGASSKRSLGQPSAASENLAKALREESLTYIARFLGGGPNPRPLKIGWFKAHDANVLKDPEAVRIVLASGVKIRLVPIAVAVDLTITRADLNDMARKSAAGRYLKHNSRTWIWFWTEVAKRPGGALFDALVIIAAAQPRLVDFEPATAQTNGKGNLVTVDGRKAGTVRVARGFRPIAKSFLLRRL